MTVNAYYVSSILCTVLQLLQQSYSYFNPILFYFIFPKLFFNYSQYNIILTLGVQQSV